MPAAVLTTIALAGFLYYALRPHEATYEGKTAADWFYEFQRANASQWALAGGPGTSVLVIDPSRDISINGMRALGTNAAVYLGHEFLREDGRLARNYRQVYIHLPVPIRTHLPNPAPDRAWVRMQAASALEALGQEAVSAVPSLVLSLCSTNSLTVTIAFGVLRRLDFDRSVIDPLVEQWSRGGQYSNVLIAVMYLHPKTQGCARALARGFSSPDPAIRHSFVYELEKYGPAAAVVLPELIAALTNSDAEVRYYAARVLQAVGPAAAPAIPALGQATNDTSVMVQRAASRALKFIQN